MRISRKKRPDKPLIPFYNVNSNIKVLEVRVLDLEGNNVGVMTTEAAIALAAEKEMDLVEINPKADPPVCKLIDFSHFKYQKEKELRKQKAGAHESETKGIRLSIRISEHDLGVRLDQAEKFLGRGDKVKPELILRGRENTQPQIAFAVVKKFYDSLAAKMEIRYEQEPIKQANKIMAIISRR
ncbi:MAG: translation initiation factor IF-3 [Candidatus Magasanikbacteria bacterium GW2011_GWC2_37_14]|uniref:Translation initiation factor IF-3 n=1 Tax=Candidatus Magasanikbacteria bacterium GW2011_GWC2_37_14 TaxID=1619046 RepID=A0A0G0GLK0_9BACT|nr:MAG: translation initiation factor IF-3 [Candidatus Magasanikbacteria bacterium GW2011_GWC2_37_14]